ncbi:hypothetical protein DPMN_052173 [Dreissena polymorpha]|uniref:Uncharacterized protein n=1 Tax=Dreissena polymorpha TaxID=45954 RepID=A0A9D4HR06_DREPO|nr:hypothetical protein DPMN_052173 [Dreissena polymorpha]
MRDDNTEIPFSQVRCWLLREARPWRGLYTLSTLSTQMFDIVHSAVTLWTYSLVLCFM